ncbi:uncharacterized protein DUF3127 [Roseivirga ehrenbergii]|uniref:DUF3127 domain-containing protein n=3 Tax=Roseivirga TaxID=290180 RepID=A0A0L8APX2_9BACT|nr:MULTISPECIES: DUF3127 domain-containing protein [Roseivirga]KOF04227.1 hypothetical protein OB69_01480 [Roseivirga seohaensis subsp. aquiponti]KYG72230.1 hypothetical protein MB14_09320 [Roseivirga ehrenbergii]KYG80317.1 hypothetical protein AWW67_09040 [Roseivirga seohaensis]TCL13469.1 uncharacterized protein DUF3127 [Roseivirga ehrenbergii]
MELKAKLLEIFPTQQVSASFRKREFVVEYAENPQYPEYVKFEAIQDKCDLLDSFKPNQTVNVSFNLKGRKWTDAQGQVKYFNSLQAWRITPESAGQSAAPQANGNTPPPPSASDEPDWLNSDSSDDLPF